MTTMLAWRSGDGRALESARMLLGGGGLRALGRTVRVPVDGPAWTASYRLFVDEQGVPARLSVTTASTERERTLTLNHTEDGYWLLDTGAGGARAEFDGALDLDLEFSPLYNALPIRRLNLHRAAGDHEIPVVFVSLPGLEVELTQQRYRTVTTLDDVGQSVIAFSAGDVVAELTVDADGVVLDYPGLASRL